jgi:exodeoxyribonuclease-3
LAGLVNSQKYDVLLFQEVKADVLPKELAGNGYLSFLYPAAKRGYSGLLALTKIRPLSISYGIGKEEFDSEARTMTLELEDFFVINTYFPNSRRELSRLDFKLQYNSAFAEFIHELEKVKPVVICGDFNVAHEEIDIARPKENEGNAGFTEKERKWMTEFLKGGYVDTFRMFKKGGGNYTWWTYRSLARQRNIGWRIDYAVISERLAKNVTDSKILENVTGSDHAPIVLELE